MGNSQSSRVVHRDRDFVRSILMESESPLELPELASEEVRRFDAAEERLESPPPTLEPILETKPLQLMYQGEDMEVSSELITSLGFNAPRLLEVSQCNALYDSAVLPEQPPKPQTADEIIDERHAKLKSALEIIKSKRTEITAENLMAKAMYEYRNQYFTIYNSFLILKGESMEKRKQARQLFADEMVNADVLDCYLVAMDIIFNHSPTERWLVNEKGQTTLRFRFFYSVILTIFNFTNLENFAAQVCRTGGMVEFLKHILNAKRVDHMSEKNDMYDDKITKAPLGILYNCSMFYSNREILQDAEIIECVQPYLSSPNESFQVSALLCTAYLVDEKQSEIFSAKSGLLSFYMNRLKNAMKKEDRMYAGWNVIEMVRGVGQLALNDTNKKLLAENEALECLFEIVKQMDDGQQDELSESLKAIWTLSFNEDNRKQIQSNEEWMTILKKCAENCDKSILKTVKGIQWTLNKSSDVAISNGKAASCADQHIMISYQWSDQATVKNIKNSLSSVGFKVWIDIEQMGGSTLDSMAAAVQDCSTLLMCVSQKYKDSQNCRAEAQYAFTLGKPIIPLMMQHKYKPDGWLGLIMGSKLYYNFSKPKHFPTKITELTNALKKRKDSIAAEVEPVTAVSVVPVASAAPGPESQKQCPSQEHADEWMKTHEIKRETFGKLTAEHLTFLKNIKHEAPEFYYRTVDGIVRRKISIEQLDEIVTFSSAIDQF